MVFCDKCRDAFRLKKTPYGYGDIRYYACEDHATLIHSVLSLSINNDIDIKAMELEIEELKKNLEKKLEKVEKSN
jgi:hypothetical protein